jgi:hypothetical protein
MFPHAQTAVDRALLVRYTYLPFSALSQTELN